MALEGARISGSLKAEVCSKPRRLFVYECRGPCSPRLEPGKEEGFLGLWPESPFFYLFFDRFSLPAVKRWLEIQQGNWVLKASYELDYEQWQQVASADYRVGPFLIRTQASFDCSLPETRNEIKCEEGLIAISMNPGLVFGSGLHPTTRGCLLAIARIFESKKPRSVVDLGTGTGILAVACGLLGALRVRAFDLIPLAVRVAADNVRANGLLDKVDLLVARELSVFREPSDLLLMNIEWPFLKQAIVAGDWRKYGQVVLSGFLEPQWKDLLEMLPRETKILFRDQLDGWVTAVVSAKA